MTRPAMVHSTRSHHRAVSDRKEILIGINKKNYYFIRFTEDLEKARKKRSRWGGSENDKTFIPGMPTILPASLDSHQQEAYLGDYNIFLKKSLFSNFPCSLVCFSYFLLAIYSLIISFLIYLKRISIYKAKIYIISNNNHLYYI